MDLPCKPGGRATWLAKNLAARSAVEARAANIRGRQDGEMGKIGVNDVARRCIM